VTDHEQDARERESREALDRVRRDSETVGSSSMARLGRRLGDHLGGQDAVGEDGTADPIELWGRRIGRSLSIIAFIALSLWLAHQLRLF
jgi:ferric-dicitrate binding protein FerR (iron transport regulator)